MFDVVYGVVVVTIVVVIFFFVKFYTYHRRAPTAPPRKRVQLEMNAVDIPAILIYKVANFSLVTDLMTSQRSISGLLS